jgi:hypothetical protein
MTEKSPAWRSLRTRSNSKPPPKAEQTHSKREKLIFYITPTPTTNHTMLAKFDIDYVIHPQHNKRQDTHRTDDPVEAEDFLMNLLAVGARINAIKHEGIELEQPKADRMLRVAAERMASRLLGRSLDLDSVEVKHRFGFAA